MFSEDLGGFLFTVYLLRSEMLFEDTCLLIYLSTSAVSPCFLHYISFCI